MRHHWQLGEGTESLIYLKHLKVVLNSTTLYMGLQEHLKHRAPQNTGVRVKHLVDIAIAE